MLQGVFLTRTHTVTNPDSIHTTTRMAIHLRTIRLTMGMAIHPHNNSALIFLGSPFGFLVLPLVFALSWIKEGSLLTQVAPIF